MIAHQYNTDSKRQFARKKLPTSFLNIKSRYLFILVIAFTAIGINYSYSISMIILTTFVLAYLTKGSRRR